MLIGCIQFASVWENHADSRHRITELLARYPDAEKLSWLILPEMALSGFSMDLSKTELCADDEDFFCQLAQSLSSYVTYGGVRNGINQSITISPNGELFSLYEKMHLFSLAGEDKVYRPGKKVVSMEFEGMRISPLICYDLRFPYLFWNTAEDTDLYVVIANWPAARRKHWRLLLQARAVENLAYVIGVNRVGADPSLQYSGDSLLIAPDGEILMDAGGVEGLHTCCVTPNRVTELRNSFPAILDRKKWDKVC